jgi:hypothetical protein
MRSAISTPDYDADSSEILLSVPDEYDDNAAIQFVATEAQAWAIDELSISDATSQDVKTAATRFSQDIAQAVAQALSAA